MTRRPTTHQPRASGRFAALDPADVHPDPAAFKARVVEALRRNKGDLAAGPRDFNELAREVGTTGGALRPRLDGHRPLPMALAARVADVLGIAADASQVRET